MGEFHIDPSESEKRKTYMEQMQLQLERTLAAAKTADLGLADEAKDQQLRQIVENAQPEAVEVEKLTAEGSEAIRQSHDRTDSSVVRQQRKVMGFLAWLSSTVEGLFAKKEKRKTQCAIYGHNLPWGTKWDGPHPKCLDCDAEILSADELRKSSSKDSIS